LYDGAIRDFRIYITNAIKAGYDKDYIKNARQQFVEAFALLGKYNQAFKYAADIEDKKLREQIEFRIHYIKGDSDRLRNTCLYKEYGEFSWRVVKDILENTDNNELLAEAKKKLEVTHEYA
jgi:predicted secreted protein